MTDRITDQQDVVRRARDQRRIAVARQDLDEQRKAWWGAELQNGCPKCGAVAGVRCRNLADVKLGREPRSTVRSHEQRISGHGKGSDVGCNGLDNRLMLPPGRT